MTVSRINARFAELKAADESINQLFIDRLGPEDHALLVALLKRLIPVGE